MKLDLLKIIFAVIILVVEIVFTYLPLTLKKVSWITRCEALASGVFLGAGFLHLLPESHEMLEGKTHIPLAFAITLAVFLAFSLIDYFVHAHSHSVDEVAKENQKVESEGISQMNLQKEEGELDGDDYRSLGDVCIPTWSLIAVMIFHSIFESVALGVLPHQAATISMFVAIIGHKPVATFSLGLVVLKERLTKLMYWILMSFFIAAAPVAILIAVQVGKEASPTLVGIITALSAGTFIFVGTRSWGEIFEAKHKCSHSEAVWKFGMMIFGVLWMLAINLLAGEHSHSH